MLAILVVFTENPIWGVGPMVVSILTCIALSLLILSRPSIRDSIGYVALVSALCGLIYHTTVMIVYSIQFSMRKYRAFSMIFVYYGFYISFAFVPGIIAFYRISKSSVMDRFLVYFAYLWTFIVTVIGLAMTIIYATSTTSRYSIYLLERLIVFMHYACWAYVPVYILLMRNIRALSGTAQKTLVIYSLLNILPVVIDTIVTNSISVDIGNVWAVLFSVLFVFCTIPTAISLIIATCYGHLWVPNSGATNGDKVELSESVNSRQVDIENNIS